MLFRMFDCTVGLGSPSLACLHPHPTPYQSPPPHPAGRQAGRRPVLGPTAWKDGCRWSQALLAGRWGFWGKGGGEEGTQLQGRCCCHQRCGCARRQPCMLHQGPLTPCPYSLPSLSLSHLPKSSFHAWRACQGCAWTRAGCVDPSTPPRCQHCAKSC